VDVLDPADFVDGVDPADLVDEVEPPLVDGLLVDFVVEGDDDDEEEEEEELELATELYCMVTFFAGIAELCDALSE